MNKLKKVAIALAVILFIISNIKYTFGVTGKITAETIRVRAEASTDSKIVVIGNAGEKAEILGLEGDWYKVRFKEKEGYIYKDYLEPEGTVDNTTTTNTTTENNNQTTENTPSTDTTNTAQPNTDSEKTMELGNVINSETQAYLLPNFTSTKVLKLAKDKEVKVNTTMANWAKIETDGVDAWVPKVFLMKEVEDTKPEQTEEQPEETTETQPEETTTTLNKAAYISSNASANLRSGPSTSTTSLGKLPKNTKITIIAEEGDWYKVSYDGKEGYISKTLVTEGEPPASATSSRSQEEPRTNATATSSTTSSVSGSNVVQVAENYYGSRYVSGGSSPSGFDCSGFTQYVYGKCGKTISRTSYTQANEGTAVSKSELQPGDLLLFHYYGSSSIGHVGIYVGDGKFIHAANSNRGVVYDSITSGYYADNYAGARRL